MTALGGVGALTQASAYAVSDPARPHAEPRHDERQPLAVSRVTSEASLLFSYLARTGKTFPSFRASAHFEQTGELPVVVRFASSPSTSKLASLGARGVRFTRGNTPTISGAYLARVTRDGLAALEEDPEMTRVSVDLPRRSKPPLDDEAKETGALIARRAILAKEGKVLDGTGTVIADIDTPVDLFHPAFFRADAGAYPWTDVDGDGRLTIGTDGVDLDGNGTIEPAEVLLALPSEAAAHSGAAIAEHTEFAPDLDFLFLDTNGNHKRDAGEGFSESTPAYGEPLFVFDDANHDGILQASERVFRLGTSKFRRIRSGSREYERGASGKQALSNYDPAKSPRAGQTSHATGIDGVLVGGQPGISRWLGVAPGAELLLHETDGSEGGTVSAVQWAVDHGANVILTEYAQYAYVSLDGSGEDEAIIDAANDAGILTVSPSGNLVGTKKHRTVTVGPGVTTLVIAPDSTFASSATVGTLGFHYKGEAGRLKTSVKLPSGATFLIPEQEEAGIPLEAGITGFSFAQQTPRGTHEQSISLLTSKFPGGRYELQLALASGTSLEVDVYLSDDVSVWQGGFAFTEETESRTMCNPSTSDKTIAVGAYVLHDEPSFYPDGKKGELAAYSSRGPLLHDRGTAGVDLIAPDNAIAAAPRSATGAPLFGPASGTSGAGPHVAGAIALLRQAFPGESASDLRKRLYDHAKPEPTVSGGESASGHGKLDIAAAAGAIVADGKPPTVQLDIVAPPRVGTAGATLRVSAEDDEPGEALTARWDLDYDGTYDTEWLPLGEQVAPLKDLSEGSSYGVKVEVRDGQGLTQAATAILAVLPSEPRDAAPSDVPSPESCGCRVLAAPDRGSHSSRLALALGMLAVLRRRRPK